jgi:hypothetical protein
VDGFHALPDLPVITGSEERVDEWSCCGASEDEEEADAQQHEKQWDEPEFFVVLQEVDELGDQAGLAGLSSLFEGVVFIFTHGGWLGV